MLILAKSVLALMIGFLLSTFLGLIIIPILKKMKIGQRISIYLANSVHRKKAGTPTMGGIIFILSTIISIAVLFLMGKLDFSYNIFIVIFVLISYASIGFIDDYLSIKRNNNVGLTEIQKLLLQLLVAIVFFFLYMKSGNDPIVEIYTLNIRINLGFMYGFFILFVLIASANAVNITDGLDGLAAGLSAIAFLSFGLISWGAGWVAGYEEIAILCFIMVGSLLGFLIYNSHPAKVFMGDVGSLALGATLATIAILTGHELTLVVVAGVFVVETLVTIIQIITVKLYNKRFFLMTPLHHHFEKLGWEENDIIKLFWVVGFILGMAGIAFGVWI
ncbi:MAG: phospho-N-acetylmuramoyl-pentapeptide-transferase [Bacilli bacterium]|jgi:phospho-N-acetylmuramoyl-pentapeptide-transferase|nr:phospho-N-acetylmuramoyl-pentapeptide-transferase [Bacilli bacterium]